MTEYAWHELHWPRPLFPDMALEMLRRLAAERSRSPFVFEAIGSGYEVRYRLGVPRRAVSTAKQLFTALVPGVVLEPSAGGATVTSTAAIRLTSRGAPLGFNIGRPIEASRSLLAALAAAGKGESLILQIFIGEGRPAHLIRRNVQDPRQGFLDQLISGPREAPSEVASRMRDKASEHALMTVLRVGVDAADTTRRHGLLKGVVGALRLAQSAGTSLGFTNASTSSFSRIPQRGFIELTPSEILGVAAWPLGDSDLPGLAGLHPKPLRLRGEAPKTERVFAITTAPGDERQVGLAIEDSLYHSQIMGPTGVGKSNVLTSLIAADIAAGRSVVVVDPKSDLILESVLARVPFARRNDVVILDPLHQLPLGMNVLNQPGRAPELIADSIVSIIRSLFPNEFGPRTSDVLNASLLTLVGIPGATMTWLVRLLTEPGFRIRILGQITDPLLQSYWLEFDSMSPAQQAQYVGPVLSRLRQFLLRPQLRRVLDQAEPKFNLSELFTGSPKILLVPLNSGLLGTEATGLLGSLLVSQLWGLTLARAGVPEKDRTPVVIYIDEASEFVRASGAEISDALARSRSLGVSWNFAFQYRAQFPEAIQQALDVNARSKIVFQLAVTDAKSLVAQAPGLEVADVLALPRYHVYCNLIRAGEPTGWFSARTLLAPPVISDPQKLIALSQRRYGQGIAEPPTSPSTEQSDQIGRRRRDQ